MRTLHTLPAAPLPVGALRMMPIEYGHMAPELRHGDYVAVTPANGFRYDSLYVLEEFGIPAVYRCQHVGGGQIRVTCNDENAPPRTFSVERFADVVVGLVVMKCSVLDSGVVEAAIRNGRAR